MQGIEFRYLIAADQANNQFIHNQPFKRLQYRYAYEQPVEGEVLAGMNEIAWTEWFDIQMVVQGEVYDECSIA